MATRRQIKANRANAKFCTGPKTEAQRVRRAPEAALENESRRTLFCVNSLAEAGKQIVSQNAVTHGLFSKAVVLKAESSKVFEELLASMVAKFNPQDATDHALIERGHLGTRRTRKRRI